MSTLDKVREIIRAEVAKANAIEAARPSLEWIILSAISWTETGGSLAITVQSGGGRSYTLLVPDSSPSYAEATTSRGPSRLEPFPPISTREDLA